MTALLYQLVIIELSFRYGGTGTGKSTILQAITGTSTELGLLTE